MSTKQDRIANLLAQNMAPALIARIVGCDASYISQLMKDEAFSYHLSCLREELQSGEAVVDEEGENKNRKQEALFYVDKLAATEQTLLDKVISETPYMSGREAVVALDVVGKRRDAILASLNPASKNANPTLIGININNGDGQSANVVQITIPSICAPELTIAGNSEIIAIGNRSVAPMPTATLQKMLAKEDEDPIEVHYENHSGLAEAL